MKYWKTAVFALIAAVAMSQITDEAFAQKRRSSSGFGGSKYSSGSRNSGGSKYSSGQSRQTGSKYSSGTQKKTYGNTGNTGSKYSSGTQKKTNTGNTGSKYSSGNKPTNTGSTKYSNGSRKPTSGTSPPTTGNSKKPTSTGSKKATANKQAASQRQYVESKKATAPAKSSYTTSSGKTVNVRKDSKAVSTIRSKPSSYYTPQQRTQRTEVHIHNHGYSHGYGWYHSQPSYYVGGGYSSAFWWMMMEWNAERRARWLYHNQNNIERAAYERGMQDQAVAAELAKLQAQGVATDPNYIDSEFADNPDLMYSQDYVEAAYNPTVKPTSSGGSFLAYVVAFILIGAVVFFVLTRVRFGK